MCHFPPPSAERVRISIFLQMRKDDRLTAGRLDMESRGRGAMGSRAGGTCMVPCIRSCVHGHLQRSSSAMPQEMSAADKGVI